MKLTRTFVAFAAVSISSAALAADPKVVSTVEGITEYAFDNGLRVLLFPEDSKPTVTVNATYLVGSRHEGYGETGMAHLLEHMLFKGTPKHGQVWKELQEHGAQFNGSTNYDRTNYFETLAATDENLDFALDLESDRMVNSFVAKKDLESEFTVVRNEFEMGENSPSSVLSERVMSTAYLWHNYGKSTIGSREDIERVPIERLQAFYRKFYQPDNCVLTVAGKFDEKKTLAKIAATFGAIPKPTREIERPYTWEPTQDGEREVTLRRVGDAQTIDIVYHVCAGPHEDFAPVQVLSSVLDADKTGRLYKALVEPGLATRVSASAPAMHDPGIIEISAQARVDQSMPELRKKLIEVLDGLATAKFTDEEVKRAQAAAARGTEMLLSDTNRVGVAISEWAAAGDWRLLFVHRDRVAKVTPADLQRVAARYLKPSNRTVGTFAPDKAPPDRAEIPQTPDVTSLVKDYRGGAAMAKGAAFEATYANIEAKTTRAQLPGGMKVAFLPKDTRNDRVSMSMTLHYGSEADLTGKTDAASMLGRMLMRGTTKHDARQIQDLLDQWKANVRIGGGGGGGRRGGGGGGGASPGQLDVSIECGRAVLPQVLELTAEILREPAFPAEEFEKMKKETLASQEERLSDPNARAMNELQRALTPVPPSNIRYVPTLAEQIERTKALKLDDVKGLYTNLVGASFAEAAAVGDFDPAEVTAALTKRFGDWKSPKPFARIARPYIKAIPEGANTGALVIETPDKTNALFLVGSTFELRDDDPDYPALFAANYILGGMSDSRLSNRIRQKEGLSYGTSSMLQASAQDKSGSFIGTGICAPENAEKALTCALEEIDKLVKEGVPQQELDDARKGYHQALDVQLSNDGAIAGMLASNLYLDRTMKFSEERLKKIDALTPKDLTAAFTKYIQGDKIIRIRAGDFSKKADAAKPAEAGKTPDASKKTNAGSSTDGSHSPGG